MAKYKTYEFQIIDTEFPNRSIGYSEEDKIIRVKGGIRGQKIKVKRIKEKNGEIKGKLLEILEKSPLERESRCMHSEECGGCTYQSMDYETEVEYKRVQLEKLFVENNIIEKNLEIIKSPEYKGYRNKMEYTFGDEYLGSPLALGLHKKGRFHEIVNTDQCNIVHEDFNIVREGTRKFFQERKMPFYNRMRHTGVLRHLVIRRNEKGDMLLNLVTSSQEEVPAEDYINFLLSLEIEGKIKSVFHTINDGLGDAINPDEFRLIYGEDHIIEEVLGLQFKVTPFSFFQTNTKSAERLYELARELAGNNADKVIFDLYSGTGTIAQIMAKGAKKVIGIEIVEEAVESAKENAKINRLENVEFIPGDVLEKVGELKEKPDLIILDPPREGIHPKAINKIIDFEPKEFIYISCNPVTMERDLGVFGERGYEVKYLKAVDQFPRTTHCEAVARLERIRICREF